MMHDYLRSLFDLIGRVTVITGAGGLLGRKHAECIAGAGGIPVLLDIHPAGAEQAAADLRQRFGVPAIAVQADITKRDELQVVLDRILRDFGRIDILINNAANNPKVETTDKSDWSRFETFKLEHWQADLDVGITGAFLCSQVFGAEMARQKRGVILNIASFLGVVAPDQRCYRQDGLPEDQQPVKPVSYTVTKAAMLGLTMYLSTYWADAGVRVNAISPGGVANGQPDEFVQKISALTPMARMANPDEFQGAVLYLCSDASSYVTGINLVVDGGRTVW